MILRNNGDILVIAPSLIITRAEAEWVIDLIDRAITAAIEEPPL
jgi:adenosylmethionine-8-amino-7-oxononanoate aminotransferase